jgi:hypothetical protein
MYKQLFAVVMAASLALPAWAETCRSDIQASTPSERFDIHGVTVTDRDTTLSWMRCAVGQHWSGDTCVGKAKTFDWQHAMAEVKRINAAKLGGHNDWRMPMVPELASIVERQCFNPRMNTEVFAGAPSVVFWSAMEKMGRPDYAYTLDFGGGAARATAKDQAGAVRLVRGGPWWEPPQVMSQR